MITTDSVFNADEHLLAFVFNYLVYYNSDFNSCRAVASNGVFSESNRAVSVCTNHDARTLLSGIGCCVYRKQMVRV